ncbi:hypothetical protein T484DRAFT_1830498 [Baffinella frigidus]|nr:hypothetical protein T484DRAFT_1830498 [Cryptophyta sp. CCMP2293]
MTGNDAEVLMGLLERRTGRETVPVLLLDEPFPEHVFMEISSVPKDVLRPADEWLGKNDESYWKLVRSRYADAHELHSFVGPRPSNGSATSTPTPFLRSNKGVKDVTSCDDRTSSRAEKDAPHWKTEWRRRKQLKEGPVSATRHHSAVPRRTGSAPNRSPVGAASARGQSSTRSRSSATVPKEEQPTSLTAFYHSMKAKFPNVRASCLLRASSLDGPSPSSYASPPSSPLTADTAAPNFINRTYTISNRSADHVPGNHVHRNSTTSPLNLSPHQPPASPSTVPRILPIHSAHRAPAPSFRATALRVNALRVHALARHLPLSAAARLLCPAQAPHRVEYTDTLTVEV